MCVCVFLPQYSCLCFDLDFVKMDVLHDDSLQVNESLFSYVLCVCGSGAGTHMTSMYTTFAHLCVYVH